MLGFLVKTDGHCSVRFGEGDAVRSQEDGRVEEDEFIDDLAAQRRGIQAGAGFNEDAGHLHLSQARQDLVERDPLGPSLDLNDTGAAIAERTDPFSILRGGEDEDVVLSGFEQLRGKRDAELPIEAGRAREAAGAQGRCDR